MPDTLQAPTQELIAELLTRGASMEQVARLKDPTAKTPTEALQRLKDGNSRFYCETSQTSSVPANARRAQIMSQTPFAVVLGCADSRVPVEIIFDQGPGDIFSIRVAGNVVEPGTLGSAQYAVTHLKVHLIVVLGHEGCGAVAAAMLSPEARSAEAPEIQFLLDKVEPSVRDIATIRDHKARMREAVISNVRYQKTILESDPVMSKAIASGQIQVVGAFYEIGSGAVDFLDD